MSLRSGIINDYSVPMGTSRFARPTRDLNWTIYWSFQVPLDTFIPVQAALISESSSEPFYDYRVGFLKPWENYGVYFTPQGDCTNV